MQTPRRAVSSLIREQFSYVGMLPVCHGVTPHALADPPPTCTGAQRRFAYEWRVWACWPLPLALLLLRWKETRRCHDTTSVQLWSKASLALPGGVHVVLCDGYGILTNDLLACSTETTPPP